MPDAAASVIITNHNYARFLPSAIDSALRQDSDGVEVIVVDDGSTDDSRAVIAGYGRQIQAVLKPCGGQASAMNAGFAAARGQVIVFLDADDLLDPSAVRIASAALRGSGAAKAHWQMEVIDDTGQPVGRRHPTTPLPEGDYRDELIAHGPWMCENPPTSGNAWSRRMLRAVMPIPEQPFRLCADAYLLAAAPLHGRLLRIERPLGFYRLHDRNNFWNRPFEEQLIRGMTSYQIQCDALSERLSRAGIRHDRTAWLPHSWWHRVRSAVDVIMTVVPAGRGFALADEDQWGTPDLLRGRRRVAFPTDRSGRYSGPPATDDDAVAQLEQIRRIGLNTLALGWPAAWYPDVYPDFARTLRQHWKLIARHDAITVYGLP